MHGHMLSRGNSDVKASKERANSVTTGGYTMLKLCYDAISL